MSASGEDDGAVAMVV